MLRLPLVKGGAPAVSANAVAWLETAGPRRRPPPPGPWPTDDWPFTETVASAVPRPMPALASNCSDVGAFRQGQCPGQGALLDGPSLGSGAAAPSTLRGAGDVGERRRQVGRHLLDAGGRHCERRGIGSCAAVTGRFVGRQR